MDRIIGNFKGKNKGNFILSIGVLTIFGLVMITNIVAIQTLPSWFDGAFMADIVFNLKHYGDLSVTVMPTYVQGEILIYGPVYFYLQLIPTSLLGFNEFSLRILNLSSGILTALVFSFLIYRELRQKSAAWILFLLIIADISFNRNMVSGRMDLVALLFVMLSFLNAFRMKQDDYINTIGAALFAAIAYLTTPRAVFLLFGPFTLIILKAIQFRKEGVAYRRIFPPFALASLFIVLPIIWWVSQVGGIENYISLFAGNDTTAKHIGASFFRSFYDNIPISMMIILTIIYWKTIFANKLMFSFVFAYIFFSLFVEEVGPYAGMIMPFVYSIIIFIIYSNQRFNWSFKALLILPLIGLSMVVLLSRSIDFYKNFECRDKASFKNEIADSIGAKSSVLSEFKFYYHFKNDRRRFEVINYMKGGYIGKRFFPDYIVLSKHKGLSCELEKLLASQYRFEKEYICTVNPYGFLPTTYARRTDLSSKLYKRIEH